MHRPPAPHLLRLSTENEAADQAEGCRGTVEADAQRNAEMKRLNVLCMSFPCLRSEYRSPNTGGSVGRAFAPGFSNRVFRIKSTHNQRFNDTSHMSCPMPARPEAGDTTIYDKLTRNRTVEWKLGDHPLAATGNAHSRAGSRPLRTTPRSEAFFAAGLPRHPQSAYSAP